MLLDKMVWTRWHGQNGTEKMVEIFGIYFNSSKINIYLVNKSHKEVINTQRKPKGVKVEAGLMKHHVVSWSGIGRMMILSIPFYPYHCVRTILSVQFCPIPLCPYAFLFIPACSYNFVRTILSYRTLSGAPDYMMLCRS